MSRKKNRLAAGKARSNGRGNIMQIHKKAKEQGREIVTRVVKNGEVKLEKKTVARAVTPLERAHVQLNHAREKNLEQQKMIAQLRKAKAEAELRADQLEIKLSIMNNEAFRKENGLVAGMSQTQDAVTGEWFWDKAPEDFAGGTQTVKATKADEPVETDEDETDEAQEPEGEERTESPSEEPEPGEEIPEEKSETTPASQG